MTTIQRAIPWLDTYQRSRGLEGDVIVLGIGDGRVMVALGAQVREGERFVIIDRVNPGVVADAKRTIGGRDLIFINEDPHGVMGTEAIDLERGQYRFVVCESLMLDDASPLLCQGGLVACGPAKMVAYPLSLFRVGIIDSRMILTNDETWQDDYRKVLSALPKEES